MINLNFSSAENSVNQKIQVMQVAPTTPPLRLAFDVFAKWLAVAATYYLAARLGLLIPYIGSHVSLVWLPTGIAIAAYCRWGGQMALAIFVAAFMVNLGLGGPIWMALGIAGGNAFGPWLTARLLQRFDFDTAFTRRYDLCLYLGAVAVGMLATASNGVFWLGLGNQLGNSQTASTWAVWWIGDAVGALLGGIPLLTINRINTQAAFGSQPGIVNLVLVQVVVACGVLGFSPWGLPTPSLMFPLIALPLFVIALLALRAGIMAASLAVLLLSMTAAWGTARGVGPFAGQDTNTGLLSLWSYLTAQACTTVLLCGLTAELLASRRQQTAFFRRAYEGILEMTADGSIQAMNPAARAMLGVQPGHLGVLSLEDLPLGNGHPLQEWLQGMASGHRPHSQGEVRLLQTDGTSLEVEVQHALHVDARGRELTQLILRDVTERRHTQARLAASEERLRAITDNAPILIAEIDRDLRIRFANKAYKQWLDLDPSALLGKSLAEAFGEEVFQKVQAKIVDVLEGIPTSYERKVTTPKGSRWLKISLAPKRCASGQVLGIYAVGSDITAYRKAEKELRLSEQRLRIVTDHLPMRVAYVDEHLQYRFVNRAYEQSFGRPRDLLYAMTVREVLGDGAYQQVSPYIQRALEGETQTFDSEITTMEGYRCYRANYVPQFADDGQHVLGFVSIVVDTTAQKLEERRLIELSLIDPLTGLLNRAGFELRCQEAIDRCRATQATMAILFLDVDGFKQVNDRHGHLSGDILLKAFAGRLRRTLRGTDVVARQGGDEFLVILEGLTGSEDASFIAAKIVDAMQDLFILEQHAVAVTTSVGVTVFQGQTHITQRDLIKQADGMLYRAKAEGRNRFCAMTASG